MVLHATKTPPRSFYRIIVPSMIKDQKMIIPENFANVYWDELLPLATLIVPSGQVFCVKLQKSDKMIWLRKGWKEFVEHHSISCGFFLVFDYKGHSEFNVHIFDLTATEIKYPENLLGNIEEELKDGGQVLRKIGRPSNVLKSKPSPVFSQETTFNECSLQGGKRKRCLHTGLPTLFQFAPEFAMIINKYGKCILKSSFDILRNNGKYQTRNKRHRLEPVGERISKPGDAGVGTPKAITVNDELFAEIHENSVKSSQISNESELRKCQHCTEASEDTQLANLENHEYSVISRQQLSDDSENTQLGTLNNKGDGQVKVKQDKEDERSDLNIFFTRSMTQGKDNAFDAALKLKLENPYFMNILKKHNVDLSYILHVPTNFGNKHLSSKTQFLKLQGPDGDHLEVSCFSNGEVRYLSRRWITFVKKYSLFEGDVCVFELIQAGDVVFKVHIFYAR